MAETAGGNRFFGNKRATERTLTLAQHARQLTRTTMLNTLPEELYTKILHSGCSISAFHMSRAWDRRSRATLDDPFTIARLLMRGAYEERESGDIFLRGWLVKQTFGECLQRFLNHSSLPTIIRHLMRNGLKQELLILCASTLLKGRENLSDESVRNCQEGCRLIIEHLSVLGGELDEPLDTASLTGFSSGVSLSDDSASDDSASDVSSADGFSFDGEDEDRVLRSKELVSALGRLHRVWREAILPDGDAPAFSAWCEHYERISEGAVPSEYLWVDDYLRRNKNHGLQSHIFHHSRAVRSVKTVFLVLMSGNVDLLERYKASGVRDFEILIRVNLKRRSNWSELWGRGLMREWGSKEAVEMIGQAALCIPKKQLPRVRNFADVHRHLSAIGYNFGTTEEEITLILESQELFDGGVRALEKFKDLRVVFRAVLGEGYLDGEYVIDSDFMIPLLLDALLQFGYKALDFPVSRRNRYDFIAHAEACQDEDQRKRLREGLIDLVVDTVVQG